MIPKTDAALPENVADKAISVEQERLRAPVTKCVGMLAQRYPTLAFDLRVQRHRIIAPIAERWPKPHGKAVQALWALIERGALSVPHVTKSSEILMRVFTVPSQVDSDMPQALHVLPQPNEAAVVMAFDAVEGVLRRYEVPIFDELPAFDTMGIPAGLMVLFQAVPPLINQFSDGRKQGYGSGEIYGARNRDKRPRPNGESLTHSEPIPPGMVAQPDPMRKVPPAWPPPPQERDGGGPDPGGAAGAAIAAGAPIGIGHKIGERDGEHLVERREAREEGKYAELRHEERREVAHVAELQVAKFAVVAEQQHMAETQRDEAERRTPERAEGAVAEVKYAESAYAKSQYAQTSYTNAEYAVAAKPVRPAYAESELAEEAERGEVVYPEANFSESEPIEALQEAAREQVTEPQPEAGPAVEAATRPGAQAELPSAQSGEIGTGAASESAAAEQQDAAPTQQQLQERAIGEDSPVEARQVGEPQQQPESDPVAEAQEQLDRWREQVGDENEPVGGEALESPDEALDRVAEEEEDGEGLSAEEAEKEETFETETAGTEEAEAVEAESAEGAGLRVERVEVGEGVVLSEENESQSANQGVAQPLDAYTHHSLHEMLLHAHETGIAHENKAPAVSVAAHPAAAHVGVAAPSPSLSPGAGLIKQKRKTGSSRGSKKKAAPQQAPHAPPDPPTLDM